MWNAKQGQNVKPGRFREMYHIQFNEIPLMLYNKVHYFTHFVTAQYG